LILTMGAMALMSTGSGEVMAISSIIVYDIYQTYLKPFRYARIHTHARNVHVYATYGFVLIATKSQFWSPPWVFVFIKVGP
jgi:Na+/proline symporter